MSFEIVRSDDFTREFKRLFKIVKVFIYLLGNGLFTSPKSIGDNKRHLVSSLLSYKI